MLVRSLVLHPLVVRGQRLGQSYFEHANVHYDIHSVCFYNCCEVLKDPEHI